MKPRFLLCCLAVLFALAGSVQAQSHILRGTVTDEVGEPLIGVNIVEKGTTSGTVTDVFGAYRITLTSPTATVAFSYVGFRRQEVTLNGQTELNVVLEAGLDLSDVVVVGTRSINRTVTETPVAIDIIEVDQVTASNGQLDLNQLLQYVAPSFNANRQSGADGADHIDPASLRGLGPDQTLVLVNGKRRHQSSLINIFGSRGRGNTGTDLNTIPTSAIERIEVLRDGAAAQYGSDAIAGVINIVLKSSVEEFSANVNTGVRRAKYREDQDYDGESYQVSGNYGVRIGQDGFLNVTTDFLTREKTNRPVPPGSGLSVYRRQYGDASYDNLSTWVNAAVPLSPRTSFYAFGGYNFRDTDAFAYTRSPDSERNIPSIYPDGFDPHITSDITDKSLSAGVRSKVKGWDVDANNTFGVNRFHYTIDGTLNATLLGKSPTRFDAGGFALSQNTTGFNFTQYFPDQQLNVAFGAEYRVDNYEIFAGEEGSYATYDLRGLPVNAATPDDQVVVLTDLAGNPVLDDEGNPIKRPGGSQGFPGFQPANVLDESRTNVGLYVDTEYDVNTQATLAAAVRFEHYSDFGSTLNGKIAGRLALSKQFALRASASTGFRAPSLAQIYFNTTFTDFVSGVPIDKIIARNNSPITRTLGIPALTEEKALNASVGFTASPFDGFTATVDGYFVDIQDRIVLTGAFDTGDPDIGGDLAALNVGAAQFFTNALDTQTLGLDVILTYTTLVGPGRLQVSYAGNFNDLELGDIATSPTLAGKEDVYFGRREQHFLQASAPPSKMNLTFDYKQDKVNVNLRFIRFGQITLIDFLDTEDVYEARVTTDLSAGYDLSPNVRLVLGAENLLNTYPTEQDTETETGGIWDAVQMGFSGSLYYGKLAFRF
jgi:iron complex outermembrane receptor protein